MREKPLILNKFRSDNRVAASDSCSPSSVVGGRLMIVGDGGHGNDVLVPQNSRFHMREGAQRGHPGVEEGRIVFSEEQPPSVKSHSSREGAILWSLVSMRYQANTGLVLPILFT